MESFWAMLSNVASELLSLWIKPLSMLLLKLKAKEQDSPVLLIVIPYIECLRGWNPNV